VAASEVALVNEPPDPPDPPPAARPRRRPPGPGLLEAIGWVFALAAGQVVFAVAGAVASMAATGDPNNLLLVFAFVTFGNLVVAAGIAAIKHGRAVRERVGLRPPRWAHLGLVLLLAPPLGAVLGEATAWAADALTRAGVPQDWVLPQDLLEVTDEINKHPGWPIAMAVAVFGGLLPGVGEELLFRGVLGRGLVARWGVVRGVLLTAFLFGAVHVHPLHAALAAALGVVLHAVYFWTRSLVAAMALHATYNCWAFLLNGLSRGADADLAANDHLPPAVAGAALLAVAGVGWLLYRSRVRWVLPDGTDWLPWFPTAETPPARFEARVAGRRPGAVAVLAAAGAYLAFVAAVGRAVL
jgi:membrane protease YdiL (CAAX protease family)